MRRWTGLVIAVGLLACGLWGCANSTYSMSHREHLHQWRSAYRHDAMGLAEDFDLLMMTDRNSRLTRWQGR